MHVWEMHELPTKAICEMKLELNLTGKGIIAVFSIALGFYTVAKIVDFNMKKLDVVRAQMSVPMPVKQTKQRR